MLSSLFCLLFKSITESELEAVSLFLCYTMIYIAYIVTLKKLHWHKGMQGHLCDSDDKNKNEIIDQDKVVMSG